MTTTADTGLKAWLPGLHEALVLILVGLRPLISGHGGGGDDQILWTALVLFGLGIQSLEQCRRPLWPRVWGVTGLAGLITLALLLPAAARATLPTSQGWNWWIGWVSLGLFALYLAGFSGPRRHLILAALGAGLAVQGILALVQHAVVHPQMLTQLSSGDGDIAAVAERFGGDLVAERLQRGGAYGTMSLANALSVFVLIVGLPLAALAWQQGLRLWRSLDPDVLLPRPPLLPLLTVVLLGGLGLATLLCAGARGGPVMAALAITLLVAWRGRGWWRWAAPLGLVTGAVVVVGSGVLDANIAVRAQYWSSAWQLIGQRPWLGWGLDGFAEQVGRILPLHGEYSRLAHNAVLDAAVAAGVPAALAVTALLLLLAGRPPTRPEAADDDQPDLARPRRLAWLLALALPYAAAFGTLDSDNLAFWPGGQHIALVLLYATGLGLVMALVVRALLRLPAAPAWALWLGVATFALACLIDFHLHNLALSGSAIALALARRRPGQPAARSRLWQNLTPLLWLGLGLAAAGAWQRAQHLTSAQALIEQLEALHDPRRQDDHSALLSALGHQLGRPDEDPRRLIAAAIDEAQGLITGWPAAPDLDLRLAVLSNDHQRLETLAEALPSHLAAWVRVAESRARRGDLDGAISAQRHAIALHPAALDLRLHLAALLRRLAEDHPEATTLRSEAEAIDEQVRTLTPIVHPNHRPRRFGTQ